jgi:hypothetical protein
MQQQVGEQDERRQQRRQILFAQTFAEIRFDGLLPSESVKNSV